MHCRPTMHKVEDTLGFRMAVEQSLFSLSSLQILNIRNFFSSLGFNPRIKGMKSCQGKVIAEISRCRPSLAGSQGENDEKL